MSYEFLEDVATADIAFRAWGKDLPEIFKAAGDATISIMIENLESIEPRQTRNISLENEELDLLLFNFIQELIYYKDSEQLLLRTQQINFEDKDGKHHLTAILQGEKLDPQRHQQLVDVKAVTLHQFQLQKTNDGWMAMVILDI
ncbi:MAG: archease [Fischerella sp.]|jgi:SHS2 domain-containing protein|uniref:archease n=1 Tax=Fischerella sp. TaxID=1191 RepID=UPI0017B26D74|nr:archease [Fischerella sp.]NWF59334.1 archease [Fischerella sp.]